MLPKMRPDLPISPFTVNILLFEAFSNMLLACLLEPLRVVRDESGAEITWTIVTHTDAPVLSSSGLRIAPDTPRAAVRACDLLIVIGGDRFRADAANPTLRQSLRLIRRAGGVVAADTGAWLLAAAGYLDGRRATLHWQLLSEFAETFPNVDVVSERYVRDGPFSTCGGASTALDFMLAEVSARYGPASSFDTAMMFLHDGASHIAARAPGQGLQVHRSDGIRRVLTLMAETADRPLPIVELARRANLAPRTLARLFAAEIGMPPGRYFQHLRLSRARDLATNTSLSLGEIALRCGFASSSALSRAFVQSFGIGLRQLTKSVRKREKGTSSRRRL
jgi:transcriptional regulator GlxA family with amidase domain